MCWTYSNTPPRIRPFCLHICIRKSRLKSLIRSVKCACGGSHYIPSKGTSMCWNRNPFTTGTYLSSAPLFGWFQLFRTGLRSNATHHFLSLHLMNVILWNGTKMGSKKTRRMLKMVGVVCFSICLFSIFSTAMDVSDDSDAELAIPEDHVTLLTGMWLIFFWNCRNLTV